MTEWRLQYSNQNTVTEVDGAVTDLSGVFFFSAEEAAQGKKKKSEKKWMLTTTEVKCSIHK